MCTAEQAWEGAPDGRLARSLNTRAAVVDALLALIEAGDLPPTALRVHENLPVDRARKVLAHLFTALLADDSAAARRKHGHRTHAG